jgi:hypothetical protein
MDRPSEATEYQTRLLRCSIEVEHARAYWRHANSVPSEQQAEVAFSDYWFGARSLSRVEMLLTNFRERFDAFPPALAVLAEWEAIDAATRRLVCHWHLQLADRLYREFSGDYLVARMESGRTEVTRDRVVNWIEQQAPGRWAAATRIQFARRLLHSASETGLLEGSRDPRHLSGVRVSDDGLAYLLHLLRHVDFDGSLTANPYLRSVGITGDDLQRRLRDRAALRFRQQGDLVEFGWTYPGLLEWAEASVLPAGRELKGTA